MIDLQIVAPAAALKHIPRHRGGVNYVESLIEDYQMIFPFLPRRVDRILDIGCGMAGIGVLLSRHYPGASLWLLDGDGVETRAGWNASLEAFSSRADAEELLTANGVKVGHWVDVNTKEKLTADLVISLASWGFHYPIKTYAVTGYCIADLRKKREPIRGQVIAEFPKRFRCAWSQ